MSLRDFGNQRQLKTELCTVIKQEQFGRVKEAEAWMIFRFICKFMDTFHITEIKKSIIHGLIHSTLLTKYVQSENTKFLQEDFWIYIQAWRTVPNHNASDRRSSIDFPQICQTEGREKLE